MQFRLLGPLEITSDGQRLTLSRKRERWLLAILLLDVERMVSTEHLIDLLWEGDPPPAARRALHSHIARIRGLLTHAEAGTDRVTLSARYGGYVLTANPQNIDVHRFRRLLRQAHATDDPAERWTLLGSALDEWRGPVLDGDAAESLRTRLCADLDELRYTAVESWAVAGLALGRQHDLAPYLARLLAQQPIRERLAELQMRALYETGRTVDALAVYENTRARLAEELGLDPGPGLRRLHEAVLRGEPAEPLSAQSGQAVNGPTDPRPVHSDRDWIPPAQLPMDPYGFVGRHHELGRLHRILSYAGRQASAVVVIAVSGTAGVGKTALAVHWAHHVRGRFPDGQLYVDLRGFGPTGSVKSPAEAIRGFLQAFGVPPRDVPSDLAGQAALYRTILAERRVLIVLDNARDADHVRPLLPAGSGSLVLVTSRNRLTSLVAAEGAHPVQLDLFTRTEAGDLLTCRLGAGRVTAEREAVEELITACARLPLALAIAAARAVTTPVPLATLAQQLADARTSLDDLATGEAATDVRSVFSWSYRTLSPAAAELFRLLGLHPGPDISTPAVASLAGVSHNQAGRLLAELARGHLVTEHIPGRYALHDLLRAYAADLAEEDHSDDRRAAMRRLLDHYLHTAYAADRLIDHQREPVTLTSPHLGVTPEEIDNREDAFAWFTAEHSVLLAALALAAGNGFDSHVSQLAWSLRFYLDRRSHYRDWAATHAAAVAAARRQDDRHGIALAQRGLGQAYARLGRYEDARVELRQALELFREVNDYAGQAYSHMSLAWILARQGRIPEIMSHQLQALHLFRAANDPAGQARALHNIGHGHAQLGDHQQALHFCQQAVDLLRRLGDPFGEAATWDSLGLAHYNLGSCDQAIICYQRSLKLVRKLGDRYHESHALVHLGEAYHATANTSAARQAWKQALHILEDLQHPDAQKVRQKLDDLDTVAQP